MERQISVSDFLLKTENLSVQKNKSVFDTTLLLSFVFLFLFTLLGAVPIELDQQKYKRELRQKVKKVGRKMYKSLYIIKAFFYKEK